MRFVMCILFRSEGVTLRFQYEVEMSMATSCRGSRHGRKRVDLVRFPSRPFVDIEIAAVRDANPPAIDISISGGRGCTLRAPN